MGVAFAREPFELAWSGAEPLVMGHWREVAYPGDTPPVVDVAAYTAAGREGRLVTFTVRDLPGESADGSAAQLGKLRGYATFWIGPFPQRMGMIGAWQDAVFLSPEARQGHVGIDFLHFCDAQLQAIGCHVVHHSVRDGRDFSAILRRLGYAHAETVYAKHLGV